MQEPVLVVEDDDCIREMVQTMLECCLGLKTIPAADGTAALRLARRRAPALVLLDIMMPGIDGLEVARHLKAKPATRGIPIIALTASATREQALAAGCVDYIQKPFDVERLIGTVQRYLPA
jgi:two-component system cell cycle response regulator DivK